MYRVKGTGYQVQSKIYTAPGTVYQIKCTINMLTVNGTKFTRYSVHHSIQGIMSRVPGTVYIMLVAVYSDQTQFQMYLVQLTVYLVQWLGQAPVCSQSSGLLLDRSLPCGVVHSSVVYCRAEQFLTVKSSSTTVYLPWQDTTVDE